MFLLERLIGVGTYSLILIIVCLLLTKINDCKKMKRVLSLYTIVLSVLAFLYVPYETADLYRIYGYVENFKNYDFELLWRNQVINSEIGLANILYWAIGKTGIPQLLPALTAFICYNCIFYVVIKIAEKNQVSGKNVAIALLFYMSIGNYMFVISGIRCMLGISLLAFCFFRENVEKKFNILHLPLYAIAALIHSFSAVLIAARFVIPIFDSKASAIRKIIYFLFLSAGAVFVLINFEDYIGEIIEKADSYLSGDFYSYVWEYVIAILTCIVIICTIAKWKTVKSGSIVKLNVWLLYDILLFVIALCVCYEFTIFHRLTTYIMPIISLPLLMTALQKTDDQRIEQKPQLTRSLSNTQFPLHLGVVVLSVALLFVACSRGTLSSLKFFVW